MLKKTVGKVTEITSIRGCISEIRVDINGSEERAMAYTDLTGGISVGDDVLLNTTAVYKKLGTGGYHFVMANLTNPANGDDSESVGHIVKCRYTPMQHTVLSAEEEESPYCSAIKNFESLKGKPVVVGQLHSQLAPAAAAVKRKSCYKAKVAYIMTDTAALPIAFSKTVTELKEKGLLDITLTCGQSFGGDVECGCGMWLSLWNSLGLGTCRYVGSLSS